MRTRTTRVIVAASVSALVLAAGTAVFAHGFGYGPGYGPGYYGMMRDRGGDWEGRHMGDRGRMHGPGRYQGSQG